MIIDLASYLDQQLRAAGIPIVGVDVGHPTDRSQWIVQFAPGATAAQQAQAQSLLQTVPTDAATLTDAAAQGLADSQAIKAIIVWQAQLHGLTMGQARAQLIAVIKALP